jgi:hypothetical protein
LLEWPAATTGGPFGMTGLRAPSPGICARTSLMLNGVNDNAQENVQEEAHDD